ncbi:NAD(P)-dependent oxidoreductase [Candidatus Woesebacteria bacterium]|nr:NAD(P)-dependent oxidoreductase [Candidatus Woesebacteria bacterium]
MKKSNTDFSKKNVLVTGGCGFIGSHLVEQLVSLNAQVTVLDIDPPHEKIRGATYIRKDILKPNLFGKNNSFSYVFHLAARCDLDGTTIEDYKVNFQGSKNLLLQLDKKTLQRFVYYSTQLTVGLFNETRFIEPSEPFKTSTLYGQSKIEGEKVVAALSRKYSFSYTIVRPTSVYGPRGKEPYRDYFLSIKRGQYVHVGKAANLVSMCYVKNLINLTLLAATEPKADSQIFYGTDFHPYTMRQFSTAAADYFNKKIRTVPSLILWTIAYILSIPKALGVPVPLYPFRLRNIQCNFCYDIQNAVRIGYDPKYNLEDGIKETLSWYSKHDLDFK